MTEEQTKGEVIIYKDKEGPDLQVHLINESVWLSLDQIAGLFKRDKSVISRHIKNIFKEGELSPNSVVAKFATTAKDGKTYKVDYYSLDMIISVGYRVNSKRGTEFRIWATQKLREYIIKGYIVNEQRLKVYESKVKELEHARNIFTQALESRRTEGYEKDLLKIITDYLNTWVILNQYDAGDLDFEGVSKKPAKFLDYEQVLDSIGRFKKRLLGNKHASQLFGIDSSRKLSGILESIKQTFGSKEVYPSLEEKAAHLFYFIIKDHPFVDGNKRIGSLLLLLFLVQNHYFYNRKGDRKINDTALATLALLVAESKPDQKNVMVKLIVNLINKK